MSGEQLSAEQELSTQKPCSHLKLQRKTKQKTLYKQILSLLRNVLDQGEKKAQVLALSNTKGWLSSCAPLIPSLLRAAPPRTSLWCCEDGQLTDPTIQGFCRLSKGLCAANSAGTVLGQGWDEILKGDVFQKQVKMNSSVTDNVAHSLGGSHLLSCKELEEFPYVNVYLGHVFRVSALRDTLRG